MSYNVENLFDTIDDPETDDQEFTPNGQQRWTERIVSDKIKNLGKVIASTNSDIIGITEVENETMLKRLMVEGLQAQGHHDYKYYAIGTTGDGRGIRNGVISKFPVVGTDNLQVSRDSWRERPDSEPTRTRDVFVAHINTGSCHGEQMISVLVNHWPSRRRGAYADQIRLDTAEQVRALVQRLTSQHPQRLVVTLGDYNDELQNDSMQIGMGLASGPRTASDFYRASAGSLFAVDSEIAPGPNVGTFYFFNGQRWNFLDHILIAGGRDYLGGRQSSYYYRAGSAQIERHRYVDAATGRPTGCETHGNERRDSCPNGSSDHFPLSATFELR